LKPIRQQKNKFNPRNHEIRVPFVTLIDNEGEKIDNCPTSEALKMAYDQDLDLVLVAPNLNPPVAKIMDWGKVRYELLKREQQQKKLQKSIEMKEIRLRPKTDSHDLEIKFNKIKEFLAKGHKVKITMIFKGREAAYLNRGRESMNEIISKLADIAKPDDRLVYQFKRLSVTLSPIKQEINKAKNN